MLSWRRLKNCWIFGEKYKGLKLQEIYTQNTKEFCHQTTLHGMKYVTDSKLRPCERCFFGISIITVVCLAIYLIARVYDKWSTTPIIVGVKPQPIFIANEPFPAVTICNMNQALDSIAKTFRHDSLQFTMLQIICKREVNTSEELTVTSWNNVERFMMDISQPCKDMFIDCYFGSKKYPCEELFKPIVTDEGLCCIFNMIHPKYMYVSHIPYSLRSFSNRNDEVPINWHAETGYPDDLPPSYYPKRVPGVGESMGLSMTLDVEQDKYYCSSSSSVGFKLALHSPDETPNLRETGVFIEPGKETKLKITPEKSETEKYLRKTNKKLRHCLFLDEGNLKFFAHYTQRNCEMECVAATTYKFCDCVSFFMPKIFRNVSVCSVKESKCVDKVRFGLVNRKTSCLDYCLPSCYEMNFHGTAFSTKLAPTGYIVNSENLGNRSRAYVVENVAVVHLFFKENSFRSSIQTEFIGISDFLSSIGGLMGLFLGFSFLSIAECIYYAIIRPCQSVRQYQENMDLEKALPTTGSSLKWSGKLPKSLKTKHKKLFGNKRVNTSSTAPLFEKKMNKPYAISYGFDGPIEKEYNIYNFIK